MQHAAQHAELSNACSSPNLPLAEEMLPLLALLLALLAAAAAAPALRALSLSEELPILPCLPFFFFEIRRFLFVNRGVLR